MAAVLEVVGAGPGAMAMAIATSSSGSSSVSRSLVVRGAATMSNGSSSSSFSRAGLPTCRGLKLVSVGKRSPGASSVRLTQSQRASNAIVCEKSDTIGATGHVTDQTFQRLVLDSDLPVLVDFWAPWCGPCRMIAPVIDELAKLYAGKLKCLKLNTDDSPYIATEYGIRSIPTVMIFKRGEKKDTVIGAVPKSTLTTTIDKYVDW